MTYGQNSDLASSPPLRDIPLPGPLLTLVLLLAAAFVMGSLVVFAEVKALAISLALLGCVFVMLDFRLGVIFLIVIMPISASPLMPRGIGGITGLNPMNLLLLGTFAAYLLRGNLRRFAPAQLVWLYVLPIIAAAVLGAQHVAETPSLFVVKNEPSFNDVPGYFRDMLIKPLFIVLFGLLVAAAAARSRNPDKFVHAMLVSAVVMSLAAIGFAAFSGASLSDLSSSNARTFFSPLGLHANDLGRLYAIAYALMLYTCAASNRIQFRFFLVCGMGLVVIALLLTFSRSALLGFLIVNALFLVSRRRIAIVVLGIALFAVAAVLVPDQVYERIGSGWDGGLNTFSAGRTHDIWLPLLPQLMENPLLGNGLGSILWSEPMRAGLMLAVSHPHNAYLQVLLDMGLIGFVLIGAFFFHVWQGFRRLAADPALNNEMRGFYAGANAGLIGFLITAISGSSLMPSLEQIFLWLAIGMMYGHRQRVQEQGS